MVLDFNKGLFAQEQMLKGSSGYFADVDTDGTLYTNVRGAMWLENTGTLRHTLAITSLGTMDIHFKWDGTKFYISNDTTNVVEEWTMTAPWNIDTATLTNNFDISGETASPRGLSLSTDGTKMLLESNGGNVYKYDLGTAWDVTSAVINQNFNDASAGTAMFWKPDGLRVYLISNMAGVDNIMEYHLTIPWDVSTMTLFQSLTLAEQDSTGIFINPKGEVMYIAAQATDLLIRYDLTIPWNLNSAVDPVTIIDTAGTVSGIFFNPTGKKLYWIDQNELKEWDMTTT